MAISVIVRGIGINRHKTNKYAIINLRFQKFKNGKSIIVSFQRESHLMFDLQTNFLNKN